MDGKLILIFLIVAAALVEVDGRRPQMPWFGFPQPKLADCCFKELVDVNGQFACDRVIKGIVDNIGGGMNMDAVFIAPVDGTYTVSASGRCHADNGDDGWINLFQNGNEIAFQFTQGSNGVWKTPNQIPPDTINWSCSGYRYVDMEKGDTLHVEYNKIDDPSIQNFYFCVDLYGAV